MNKGKWGITLVTGTLCAFIALWEGDSQKVYEDVNHVATVCNGYTGPEVKMGDVWTKERCSEAVQKAIEKHGAGVLACMTVKPTQQEYEAYASFAYNVGVANFCSSTLLKKWNAGDKVGACHELLRWNKSGGVVWKGLTNRRQAEERLCLNG